MMNDVKSLTAWIYQTLVTVVSILVTVIEVYIYFFIKVYVPFQKSERSCICVVGVSILSLSTILIFGV